MSRLLIAASAACLHCIVGLALLPIPAADKAPLPPPALPKPWKELKEQIDRFALSSDGKLIAIFSTRNNNCTTLYDRQTGKELKRFKWCGEFLLAFTPDSKRLLIHRGRRIVPGKAEIGCEVDILDVATGKLLRRFNLLDRQGFPRLYASSDKVLVACGKDEVGTIYDLDTGKPLGSLPGKHRPKLLALSNDGRWLLTCGHDDALCVWDVRKRKLLHTLYEHTNRVHAIAISADGAWCASAPDQERRVWVFDRVKGTERARTNTLFLQAVTRLLFTLDGKTLVATGEGPNHGLFVWDWQTCRDMRGGYPRQGYHALAMDLAQDESGKKWKLGGIGDACVAANGTLLTYGDGLALRLWDLKPPKPSRPPASPEPAK